MWKWLYVILQRWCYKTCLWHLWLGLIQNSKEEECKRCTKDDLTKFSPFSHYQRLYMCELTWKYMTWYKNRETSSWELSHPIDGDEWKHFEIRYPSSLKESRKICLRIGTDGFCLFDNSEKKYTQYGRFLQSSTFHEDEKIIYIFPSSSSCWKESMT